MPAYRFIDPTVLMTAVGGDVGAFRQLSEVFLSIAPDAYERLRHALQQRDLAAIVQSSHALKGSTMLVGAIELTALLQKLESGARTGELEDFDPASSGIAPQFDGVMAEVGASIAEPPPAEA